MRPLAESVAVVTGGAGGIGAAVVRRLAGLGARVTVADLDEGAGARLAAEVGGLFVATDVRDPQACEAAVLAAESAYGRVDLVHLNAGIATGEADVEKVSLERYRQVVAINQDAVFFGVRAALPALRRAGGGSIVVTASLGGLVGQPTDPVYSMTKHAAVALVRALVEPLAPENITINALCPGFVETPLLAEHVAAFRAAGFPLLQPGEVADALVTAVESGASGQAWVIQPGRGADQYRFRGVPGPRAEGFAGGAIPDLGGGG